MPRKNQNGGRSANGMGSIRQKTVTRNGKQYTYWEARCTVGYDPGTGKQIQKSITGKTQKEVVQKLRQLTAEVDEGTYQESCKLTMGEWLDTWLSDYLVNVKSRTRDSYKSTVDTRLKPAFGSVKLKKLTTHQIQQFYNSLTEKGLSAKTVKNVHGVLHRALEQAVELDYIRANPASKCKLPKAERTTFTPLDSDDIKAFLDACKGHPFEYLYVTTLFTGLREGEVLGLTWDCVDFDRNMLTIDKQLLRKRRSDGSYELATPKNGKVRYLTAPPYVMEILRNQQERQNQWQLVAGDAWEDNGLVFTNELGHNLSAQTVYLHYKKIVKQIGRPDARFHDLRHSYATIALQSGDDIKTVQENLGHHTAAFTLEMYAHCTLQMKQTSANRMEQFIHSVAQ